VTSLREVTGSSERAEPTARSKAQRATKGYAFLPSQNALSCGSMTQCFMQSKPRHATFVN